MIEINCIFLIFIFQTRKERQRQYSIPVAGGATHVTKFVGETTMYFNFMISSC